MVVLISSIEQIIFEAQLLVVLITLLSMTYFAGLYYFDYFFLQLKHNLIIFSAFFVEYFVLILKYSNSKYCTWITLSCKDIVKNYSCNMLNINKKLQFPILCKPLNSPAYFWIDNFPRLYPLDLLKSGTLTSYH